MKDADSTRSVKVQPTMGSIVLLLITTSPAPHQAARSQSIVLVDLEHMDLASMIPRTTRTGDAEHTPLLPTLLTVVTGVHTQITTSSAPPVVALSLWTVRDLGMPMDLASTVA